MGCTSGKSCQVQPSLESKPVAKEVAAACCPEQKCAATPAPVPLADGHKKSEDEEQTSTSGTSRGSKASAERATTAERITPLGCQGGAPPAPSAGSDARSEVCKRSSSGDRRGGGGSPRSEVEVKDEWESCASSRSPVIGDGDAFHSTYQILSILGKGAYAQVHLVCNVNTDEQFATKVTDLRRTPDAPNKESVIEDCCKKELEIMLKAASSEYCVGAVAAYMSDTHFFILMDRCEASLVDVMESTYFDEVSLRRVVHDSLKGLAHIHRMRIVHRDVKPENLLCSQQDGKNNTGRVRLCDFGLAHFEQGSTELAQGVYGTAPYMSPEMLEERGYDGKTDVWSLGTMVYVIQLGHFPYTPSKKTSALMKEAIRKGEPPTYKPAVPLIQPTKTAINFMKCCLQRSPTERLSSEQALLHLYVVGDLSPQDKMCITTLRPTLHAARTVGALGPRQPHKKASLDGAIVREQSIHSQSSVQLWGTRDPTTAFQDEIETCDIPQSPKACRSHTLGMNDFEMFQGPMRRTPSLNAFGPHGQANSPRSPQLFPTRSTTLTSLPLQPAEASPTSPVSRQRFTSPESGTCDPVGPMGSSSPRLHLSPQAMQAKHLRRLRMLSAEKRLNDWVEDEDQERGSFAQLIPCAAPSRPKLGPAGGLRQLSCFSTGSKASTKFGSMVITPCTTANTSESPGQSIWLDNEISEHVERQRQERPNLTEQGSPNASSSTSEFSAAQDVELQEQKFGKQKGDEQKDQATVLPGGFVDIE